MRAAAIFCTLVMCASEASAQETQNVLYVSGQTDFLPSASGGSGAVEWLHTTSERGGRVGVISGSLADAWWTYGRVGGFVRGRRAVVGATLDAGGGAQPTGRFGYQKLAVEIAAPLAASSLLLESELQLSRMSSDIRRVLRLGLKWRAVRGMTTSASYYSVSANGSAAPAILTRLDVEYGRSSMLGGIVVARRDRPATLVSQVGGAASLTSTELFGGAGFRVASYRVQMVANVARTEATRLLATLEIPFKR